VHGGLGDPVHVDDRRTPFLRELGHELPEHLQVHALAAEDEVPDLQRRPIGLVEGQVEVAEDRGHLVEDGDTLSDQKVEEVLGRERGVRRHDDDGASGRQRAP
jgi:hypothetical protein